MKIAEFSPIQMMRTEPQHFGTSKIVPLTANAPSLNPIEKVSGINQSTHAAELSRTGRTEDGKSFQSYLLDALESVNSNQMDVSKIQEKIITNPEEVDIHDVTIAMSKARMSLNLAQTVIDRLVSGWNEISTTR